MRNTARTSLKKPILRMSMSKYNFYNLTRIPDPSLRTRGAQKFFKTKWHAKSILRGYHGEQVREKQWQRMFSKNLRSVIPMHPSYMAKNDGSIESAGRGSGLRDERKANRSLRTPYMLQTFAPLERRLDVAVYRALFASSARQARQFVVHGAVTVNGKLMKYPGYLLNPGDMFQVKPDRVMFALGAPKTPLQTVDETTNTDKEAAPAPTSDDSQEGSGEEVDERTSKQILKDLLTQSRAILTDSKEGLSAKRKQGLRAFAKDLKKLMSKSGRSEVETATVEAQFTEIQNQIRASRDNQEAGTSSLPSQQAGAEGAEATEQKSTTVTDVTEEENTDRQDAAALRRALEVLSLNNVDESKPYATPWTPRDYLAPFAFIPRFLEVNQNICAAVYLRHPVARPGYSEVPSPYSEQNNSNAFKWYLRRR